MSKKILICIVSISLVISVATAQNNYAAFGGETIFSVGMVGSDSVDLQPVLRFSPFFNVQAQWHFDFSEHVGIYTGLGIRNVGLITHVTDSSNNEEKIKERSYSLGLPLALKFGDIDDGTNFAIGAEAEIMFAYKRKIMDNDNKLKYDSWFSDNVNLFNPSVFAELRFKKGQYIRFKYYMMDFLNYKGIDRLIDGSSLPDYGPESPLFYISLGSVTFTGKDDNNSTKPASTKSAYFKSKKKFEEI